MAANEMSFNQIATLLNAIQAQATGVQPAAVALNTRDFVTQAQTVLKTGYDPIGQAISQVLSRTIFSIRPYSAKFKALQADAVRYGNHVRKINYADRPFVEDDRIKITDGVDAPQQIPRVPAVVQTNFYGENVYEDYYTIYRDQYDVAFTGPDEFQRFISGIVQNASDKLEQSRENLARSLVANYIAAKHVLVSNQLESPVSVVHLLTEYNTLTGLTGDDALTDATVFQPANFAPFMKWVYSRVAQLTSMMTERSGLYHVNITKDGSTITIPRHTPLERQRVYLYAPARFQIDARVLADTYHDNFLRLAENETVNFWQNISLPDTINVHPNWLNPDGTVGETAQDVELDKIFGVIVDEETLGWTPINQWQAPAPFNARHGFTTVWIHETQRHWTDMTENGAILLLD